MASSPLRPLINHIHLPTLVPYAHAAALQQLLVAAHLAHKRSPTTHPSPPPPTILTFSPTPTYTSGRRESLPPTTISALTASAPFSPPSLQPTYHASLRGGQTTFHGPGQLVAYAILSLAAPASLNRRVPPRCHIHALEAASIAALARCGVDGARRDAVHPGVWSADGARKLCAVGVHLRRGVSAHGVGLNVATDPRWWERIVACGIEDRGVGSVVGESRREGEAEGKEDVEERLRGVGLGRGREEDVATVAGIWVDEFARHFDADVRRVDEEELDRWREVDDAVILAGEEKA